MVIERDKRLAVSHGNRSDFVLSDILYECSVLKIVLSRWDLVRRNLFTCCHRGLEMKAMSTTSVGVSPLDIGPI